jgi:hypothetical protein
MGGKMSIEAMKQALEALERADKISGYPNNKQTITSLRQAIAETSVATNDTSQDRVDETANQRHESKEAAVRAERQRIVNLLMVQHEAANGLHNYWHVAANLIKAESGENV